MRTGGSDNDSLLFLAPIGVALIVGVYLLGGPANTLEFLNDLVRETVLYVRAIAYQLF